MPSTGYTDPNFPPPNGPGDAPIVIYGYVPNIVLCILGITCFFILLVLHTCQVFKYHYWTFIPMIVACVMEVIGYIFRLLSSRQDPYMIGYFVAQYFCITCAPVFVSACIYIDLTEILFWSDGHGFKLVQIPPKTILWTFIAADIFCTALQITGSALIGHKASQREDPTQVNYILISGLAVQALAFLIFLLILAKVIITIFSADDGKKIIRGKGIAIAALSCSGLLVILRTIFRLIESAQGVYGYLSSHEAFFGSLEYAPIVVAVTILSLWHPGRIFGGRIDEGVEGTDTNLQTCDYKR